MKQDPQNTEEDFEADNFSLDSEEDDWGEDWESAFQAEDDTFSQEETTGQGEELFLEEEPTDSTSGVEAKQTKDTVDARHAEENKKPSFYQVIPSLVSHFLTILAALKKRYLALTFYKQVLFGLTSLALLSVIAFLAHPTDTAKKIQHIQLPTAQRPGIAQQSAILPQHTAAASKKTSSASLQKTHKKWKFPDFFIPVTNRENKNVAFVSIDITLIAVLNKGQELPDSKKPFVRNIIYQFFINRPYEELRRFSLARGEMGRELRDWLYKQWPDGPIETIAVNRYRLT